MKTLHFYNFLHTSPIKIALYIVCCTPDLSFLVYFSHPSSPLFLFLLPRHLKYYLPLPSPFPRDILDVELSFPSFLSLLLNSLFFSSSIFLLAPHLLIIVHTRRRRISNSSRSWLDSASSFILCFTTQVIGKGLGMRLFYSFITFLAQVLGKGPGRASTYSAFSFFFFFC